MANPTPYVPSYSYSGWQANNPTRPLPADEVDNDFAKLKITLDGVVQGLADVRRSDGALRNGVVTPDSLSPSLSLGFSFAGTWTAGASYSAGDGVVYENGFYRADTSHTAAADEPPGGNGPWTLLFSIDDIVVAGALAMPADTLTGDGGTVEFDLSFTPRSANNVLVSVGGVLQAVTEYSISGNTILFVTAPSAGYSIEVRGFATTATVVEPADGSVTEAKLDLSVAATLNSAMQPTVYDPGAIAGDLFGAQYNILWGGAVGDNTTENDTDFATIFSAANTGGYELYGPPGTYVVTENIANFHDVKKRGPWAIRRGTDTFYCNPTRTQTNRLYVDPSGSDDNDGITSDAALATMQKAFNIIAEQGFLGGQWRVVLAAGVHTEGAILSLLKAQNARVIIEGPTPSRSVGFRVVFSVKDIVGTPEVGETVTGVTSSATATVDEINNTYIEATVTSGTFEATEDLTFGTSGATATAYGISPIPTAIVSGTTSAIRVGLSITGCGDVEVRNIKFRDFDDDDFKAGVDIGNSGLVRLVNVHVENCGAGYYAKSNSFYFVEGGVINNCNYGVAELFGVIRNFETVTDLQSGTRIHNCVYGLWAKEHCTGHLDWVSIEDCTYAVFFMRSCTANASDSRIVRCGYGALLRSGSFFVPLRIDWGFGTDDKNTVPWVKDATSGFVINENTVENNLFKGQGESLMGLYAPVNPPPHTGTTAPTVLGIDLGTVVAGSLVQPGTYVRWEVLARKTGTAGTITVEFRVGNATGPTLTVPAAQTQVRIEAWMVSTGEDTQLVFSISDGPGADDAGGRGTRTFDFSDNSYDLDIRATLANAADSFIVDAAFSYTTDVVGPVE